MNILLFCSNPVNGGTAKIFAELVNNLLKSSENTGLNIYPCINIDNNVEIYKSIQNLNRLKVYSETEICGSYFIDTNICLRIPAVIRRKVKYLQVLKQNLRVMRTFIRQNRIDCVMVHNGGYVGDDLCNQLITAAYAEKIKSRIMVFHNDFEKGIFKKIRYFLYDKKISSEATKLATVSNFTRNRIQLSSFINKDISVIYNGISESNSLSLSEKQTKISTDNDKINILMIGNFMNNKGQLNFLKAAKIILKSGVNNIKFTIIGNIYDQKYFDLCIDFIAANALTQFVNIHHNIYNASEYIDLFDMLVVPSLCDESFGLISLEAMIKSKPVVAFASGGIPEVVENNISGYLVPVGNDSELADSILNLANNKNLCYNFGKNGRDIYLSKFSVSAMVQRYIDFLKDNYSE